MSRWFPGLRLGGPRVDAVVAVGTPVDSFKFDLESVTLSAFELLPLPSVNVAGMSRRKEN
jgi:hypothetical protein